MMILYSILPSVQQPNGTLEYKWAKIQEWKLKNEDCDGIKKAQAFKKCNFKAYFNLKSSYWSDDQVVNQ